MWLQLISTGHSLSFFLFTGGHFLRPSFSLTSKNFSRPLQIAFWKKLRWSSWTWGVGELLGSGNLSKFLDFSLTFLFSPKFPVYCNSFLFSLTFLWFPGQWPPFFSVLKVSRQSFRWSLDLPQTSNFYVGLTHFKCWWGNIMPPKKSNF